MTVSAKLIQNYQVKINARGHEWVADEPLNAGGEDTGPNPYDLLLGALAACKIITVQMYAKRKNWPLTGIEIDLSTQKIHAKDCEDCESDTKGMVDIIEGNIEFHGELTGEQIVRLHDISNRCPVHRSLLSETKIRVRGS